RAIYKQTKQKLDEKEKLLKSFTAGQLMENEELQKEANDLRVELLNVERNKKELKEQLEKINKKLEVKQEASSSLHQKLIEIENNEKKLNLLKEQLEDDLKSLMKDLKIKKENLEEMRR